MNQAPSSTASQRATLIALCVVFLAPAVGAWYIFNFTEIGRNKAAASHGDLIQPPRPVANLELFEPGGRGQEHRLHGKWTIAYLTDDECDTVCEDTLQQVQRIRLALGADAPRVQRVLFMAEGAPGGWSGAKAGIFPGQMIASASESVVRSFKLTESERPLHLRRLYIIDPRGYLMMSYPAPVDAAGMIKDLKRLLKYSRSG